MGTYTAPTDEDLRQITEQLWESYLDPDGGRPLMVGSAVADGMDISAAVSVTGAWNGHVVLECSAAASRDAAAAMLGIGADEVAESDIADALGEMANVIGGGVKSLLPGECALSLPHVVTAVGHRRVWPAVTEVCRLHGSWGDEPVTVSVLEQREEFERGRRG
jgi:chemotaxis protein CheX